MLTGRTSLPREIDWSLAGYRRAPLCCTTRGRGAQVKDAGRRVFKVAIIVALVASPWLIAASPAAADSSTPAPLAPIAEVSVGGTSACARMANGTVRCWGDNLYHQLGSDQSPVCPWPQLFCSTVPIEVVTATGLLTGVTQVSVGYRHVCALRSDSTAWCWGNGSSGELGTQSLSDSLIAQVVKNSAGSAPLTGIAQIVAGDYTTCARDDRRHRQVLGLRSRRAARRRWNARPVVAGRGQKRDEYRSIDRHHRPRNQPSAQLRAR